MRRIILRSTALCILLLGMDWLHGQQDCAGYHRYNCMRATDVRFSLNGQSKSASVQVGVPTELNVIVYKGQDYRISFCYDPRIIGENITARLIEKTRRSKEVEREEMVKEPVLDDNGKPTGRYTETRKVVKATVFEDDRKVLWDNTEHEMTDEVEFTCTSTKRLVVEVIAPGPANPKGKFKSMDIGCVGILVEHMPSPPMGF
ncbi:MAG: hypothetical protein JNM31_01685 [Flavobacteriales bacterium]|nr:hypothetical protein [Flavobacteriales bacterium]